MSVEKGAIRSVTNHGGGTLGGISTGEEIHFDVAFKPTATIAKAQRTVNTRGGRSPWKPKAAMIPASFPVPSPSWRPWPVLSWSIIFFVNEAARA